MSSLAKVREALEKMRDIATGFRAGDFVSDLAIGCQIADSMDSKAREALASLPPLEGEGPTPGPGIKTRDELSKRLKPCPLCGGRAAVMVEPSVICMRCGIEFDRITQNCSVEVLIAAWNKRAEAPPPSDLAALTDDIAFRSAQVAATGADSDIADEMDGWYGRLASHRCPPGLSEEDRAVVSDALYIIKHHRLLDVRKWAVLGRIAGGGQGS